MRGTPSPVFLAMDTLHFFRDLESKQARNLGWQHRSLIMQFAIILGREGMMRKWSFEAFRQFLSFEVLQQAAASLLPINGFNYRDDPISARRYESWLNERTGLEWAPRRSVPEGVVFNPEGSVFRNKARVLTSMNIVEADKLQSEREVRLTSFGAQLAGGLVSKSGFYVHQILSFSYPHVAYPEAAAEWRKSETSVRPFLSIIETLVYLTKTKGLEHNRLSSLEIVLFLIAAHPGAREAEIAENIWNSRDSKFTNSSADASQEDMRNANDLLGFLCMSGYTYFTSPGVVSLNLISISSKDKTYFYNKSRDGESAISNLCQTLGIEEK